jgi:hypothetical protein
MFGFEVFENEIDSVTPLSPVEKARAKAMIDEVDNFYKVHKSKIEKKGFIDEVVNFYKGIFPSKHQC